ncbi:MAG: esterase family protein [Muribaculaceae bacterium]|nr:esterase family protein [Muribaculaceae bacterium]
MNRLILSVILPAMVALYSFGAKPSDNLSMPDNSIVRTDSINSSILQEWRHFTVYLPAGYHSDTTSCYPVLFLLHGFSDTNQSWFCNAPLAAIADQLTEAGEIRPMIIVSPNAGGKPGHDWNGYFNMPGWNYEDFFFNEFMPWFESVYRVCGNKESRAIAGLSMGGGGAASYAQKHPELFGSAYIMSGWVHNEKNTDFIDNSDKVALVRQAVAENSCISYIADADESTLENLRSVKWYIDVGDDDFLLDADIEFFRQMRSKNIACQLRVRDGSHNWLYWTSALYTALPFISRNFR